MVLNISVNSRNSDSGGLRARARARARAQQPTWAHRVWYRKMLQVGTSRREAQSGLSPWKNPWLSSYLGQNCPQTGGVITKRTCLLTFVATDFCTGRYERERTLPPATHVAAIPSLLSMEVATNCVDLQLDSNCAASPDGHFQICSNVVISLDCVS